MYLRLLSDLSCPLTSQVGFCGIVFGPTIFFNMFTNHTL